MLGRQDGILILLIDAVAPLQGFVLAAQQLLVMLAEGCHFLFKFTTHI